MSHESSSAIAAHPTLVHMPRLVHGRAFGGRFPVQLLGPAARELRIDWLPLGLRFDFPAQRLQSGGAHADAVGDAQEAFLVEPTEVADAEEPVFLGFDGLIISTNASTANM